MHHVGVDAVQSLTLLYRLVSMAYFPRINSHRCVRFLATIQSRGRSKVRYQLSLNARVMIDGVFDGVGLRLLVCWWVGGGGRRLNEKLIYVKER